MIKHLEAMGDILENLYNSEQQDKSLTQDAHEAYNVGLSKIMEEVSFAEKIGDDYGDYMQAFSDYIHRLIMDNQVGNTHLSMEDMAHLVSAWGPVRKKGYPMNKKPIEIYSNGEFRKDEIDWIQKTPETLQTYIDETYDWEEEWMADISEEQINGLCEMVELERDYETYIKVYQQWDKPHYLVSIIYGEMTFEEWYLCEDFKTLLAFLKELEPLIMLIEQSKTAGQLDLISDEMSDILNPNSYNNMIKSEKEILRRTLETFENLDENFKEWIQLTKRKKFILNDICKEVIKANKERAK